METTEKMVSQVHLENRDLMGHLDLLDRPETRDCL